MASCFCPDSRMKSAHVLVVQLLLLRVYSCSDSDVGRHAGLLQVADEKRQASITEISLKHQKALIMEKDAKIAEMEATSSGEVARLRAAMKALKGEFSHSKNEHEAEREIISISAEKDKALQDLKDALTNLQTKIATRCSSQNSRATY